MKTTFNTLLITTIMLTISACSVTTPMDPNLLAPKLTDCPPTPNCASTETDNIVHRIEPFILTAPADQAWPQIVKTVSDIPRTTVTIEHPGYLYAKSYSKVFHFVDYLEVLSIPEENRLAVRSSSMLGLSDLGVNAKRTEALRQSLIQQNIIQSSELNKEKTLD